MANRSDSEGDGGRRMRDSDDFENRGRSEWDDDHGNGSGHGRAYGHPRVDEDNDQGRMGRESHEQWRASDMDRGDNGGWRGRGGYTEGQWRGRGNYGQSGTGYGPSEGHGPTAAERNRGTYRQGYGYDQGYGGFGGGTMGYQANRDYRATRGQHDPNYGGADLHFGPDAGFYTGDNEGNWPQRSQTGLGVSGSTGQGDYGPYSTDWAQSGRMTGQGMSQHDEDYHHWRRQQIGKLDKDYQDYRAERRKKFSDDFESWRASRPQNPEDETLANANPRPSGSTGNNATGSSQPGSSRHK